MPLETPSPVRSGASALIGFVTAGCRVRLGTSESSSAGRRYGSRSKDSLHPERKTARLRLGRRVRIRVCEGGVPLVDQILEASRVPVRERSRSHISRRSWVVDDSCRVGWRRVGRRLVRIRFGFGLGLQVLGAHVGRVVGIVGNGTDLVGGKLEFRLLRVRPTSVLTPTGSSNINVHDRSSSSRKSRESKSLERV